MSNQQLETQRAWFNNRRKQGYKFLSLWLRKHHSELLDELAWNRELTATAVIELALEALAREKRNY